jgi:hypothetical protein
MINNVSTPVGDCLPRRMADHRGWWAGGSEPNGVRIYTFPQSMAEPRDDASRIVSNALSIFLKLASTTIVARHQP